MERVGQEGGENQQPPVAVLLEQGVPAFPNYAPQATPHRSPIPSTVPASTAPGDPYEIESITIVSAQTSTSTGSSKPIAIPIPIPNPTANPQKTNLEQLQLENGLIYLGPGEVKKKKRILAVCGCVTCFVVIIVILGILAGVGSLNLLSDKDNSEGNENDENTLPCGINSKDEEIREMALNKVLRLRDSSSLTELLFDATDLDCLPEELFGSIKDASDVELFNDRVRMITFRGVKFTSISPDTFKISQDSGLVYEQITSLDVVRGDVEEFPEGFFAPLQNLTRLDLTSNLFLNLPSDTFEGTLSASRIDLADNSNLLIIPAALQKLATIDFLNLEDNEQLSVIPNNFFDGMQINEIVLENTVVATVETLEDFISRTGINEDADIVGF